MSFICEDNITMNPTTDTIIYQQEDVFKYIKKPDLDDCYICLSSITNKPESSAVFVFKCRHPICYDCLVDVSSKYAEDYIKHKMLCGICRTGTNRYLFNNKKLHKISYSETQSIMIPSNLITEQNIYSDHIQRLIAYSTIY
jgi:uncharacterized protein YjdB